MFIVCPRLSEEGEAGRCGVAYGGRCNRNRVGAENAFFCNTLNGWCGSSDAHKNAQKDDAYDWQPESCPITIPRAGEHLNLGKRIGSKAEIY